SSTFGQPTFGKPATTGFNTPVFGSTGGTSLFGGPTTQPSGSLFGSSTSAPAFGQTQTTQPAFGGFSTTGTSTGLFGTQQNANTGTSLFGSGTTSAFGQAKPSFGGFGTTQPSTGLFGQQAQQPQQQSSLFGQPATQSATGLFGGTAFGTTAQGGTTIKFTPVTGSDTMVKNGVSTTINTRHHCITCMKEYESKSLEELRLEDYAANRKGPQQGAQGSAGLFGSTGQTSMFGGGTNTGFGATGSSVFGTGANAGNTLFGKAPGTGASAFGTPATTATTSFGFNTNTSLFGNNASQVKPFGAPTQGAGLFGSTQQPSTAFGAQPAAGFGAFGTQQTVITGSLFGANKPAFSLGNTPNTGFAFGQTSTPSTTGASLFAKPATTGFGTTFGTPATTATGFPTPGFGTTNQNSFGTNLKGPNFSFGPTPTSNTLGTGLGTLGTGSSSLFGNTASKPVFGQTTGTTTGLFGTGTFGATSSPFNTTTSTGLGQNSFQLGGTGNSLLQGGGLGATQTTPTSNTINQHMLALASMPFGDSPLFKNILTTSGKANELIKPTSPAAQKALIAGQNFKVSPKSASKIKVKAIGANNMPKESNNSIYDGGSKPMNDSLIGTVRPSPKRLVLRNTSYSNSETVNKDDISNISPVVNNNLPVTSTTHTTTTSSPTSTPSPGLATLRFITPSLPTKPRFDLSVKFVDANDTITELRSHSKSFTNSPNPGDNQKDNTEQSTSSSSGDSELEDTVPIEIDGDCADHPTGIVLRRIGYYTIPPLDKLEELMDGEGRCIVDNFTIGRMNYGNIFYPESFDVAGLNIDEIVHFRHKEVVVYPDDDKKPPVGSGLNRKAQVTLDRVWPIDKTTRLPISDPVRIANLDYENKLRLASAKHGTRFVEYRPHTGSWVFKVDHFSKYGLSDSDEEDAPVNDIKKIKVINLQGAALQMKTPTVAPATFPHKVDTSDMHSPPRLLLAEEDEDMEDGINTPFDLGISIFEIFFLLLHATYFERITNIFTIANCIKINLSLLVSYIRTFF
ncbi:hypothetical protein AAG570_008887, partial [Ranatra chinensis]